MRSPIINTAQYPLDQLDSSAGQQLIQSTRAQLEEDGSCLFPGFIRTDALTEMAAEANSLAPLAYAGPTEVSPYFFNYRLGEGKSLDDQHPLKRKGKRQLAQVAADLIPESSLLHQLHHSCLIPDFLTRVIEQPVYRNCDPYQSLNISVMDEGGCQQWHFDGGNMVTTLLLQEPEEGGFFEYVPGIRSDENENFEMVRSVLDGNSNLIRRNCLQAGTLSLFRGHYSLHRVTEVIGQRQRIQSILGYTTSPNWYGNLESSILHYGPRVVEQEAQSPLYPD